MKKIHHSLADWDYRVGARLELAADKFISAPTALRTQALASGYQDEKVYLGDTLGHNIPEGRYLTYYYDKGEFTFQYLFLLRCQDISYTGYPDDCYYIVFTDDNTILYRREGGVNTILKNQVNPFELLRNKWYHFRVTWYQYIEEDLHKYLRTIVEVKVAGEWVELLSWNDELNKWADSDINRVGFGIRAEEHPYYRWMDNTEVWERA